MGVKPVTWREEIWELTQLTWEQWTSVNWASLCLQLGPDAGFRVYKDKKNPIKSLWIGTPELKDIILWLYKRKEYKKSVSGARGVPWKVDPNPLDLLSSAKANLGVRNTLLDRKVIY